MLPMFGRDGEDNENNDKHQDKEGDDQMKVN